jgi:hypothetical protein
MDTSILLIVAGVIIFSALTTRIGYVRIEKMKGGYERADAKAAETFDDAVPLGKVAYQGGLRAQEDVCHMYLYITSDHIVVYTDGDFSAILSFAQCHSIEFFILRQQQRSPFKSFVILGPFAPMLFRDKYRYMMAVAYDDQSGFENNLLLEADGYEQFRKIQAETSRRYDNYRSRKGDASLSAGPFPA